MLGLLVVDDPLRDPLAGHLADARELRVLEDLGDVGVPPHLVPFLLAGRQVAAHEADARVVQRHAHRDASLNEIAMASASGIQASKAWAYVHGREDADADLVPEAAHDAPADAVHP